MASSSEIREQVQNFLDRRIDLQSFDDWSAEYSWNIHKRADAETRDLAYAIRGLIGDYSNRDIDETSFRASLEGTIRPFAPSAMACGREDESDRKLTGPEN